MVINVSTSLLNFDGSPCQRDPKDTRPFTVRDAIDQAISMPDPTMSSDDKYALFKVGRRLYEGEAVELSLEEAVMVKAAVAKIFNPVVYGCICEMLEGAKPGK